MDKFYVFGLQRSGTNFFKSLITDNFCIEVANGPGTWWHYNKPPYSSLENHNAYVVYKNPYQWIESITYRTSADLIATNINTYDLEATDGYMIDRINLERLCRLYQDFVFNWNNPRFVNIKYESLLDNDTRVKILSSLPYVRQNTNQWQVPNKVFMSKEFDEEQKHYYSNGSLKHLKNHEIDIINRILCDEVFLLTGYNRISSKEQSSKLRF